MTLCCGARVVVDRITSHSYTNSTNRIHRSGKSGSSGTKSKSNLTLTVDSPDSVNESAIAQTETLTTQVSLNKMENSLLSKDSTVAITNFTQVHEKNERPVTPRDSTQQPSE